MSWEDNRWMRRALRWPEHLQVLAGQLAELANRVRESVSELVGENVGTAVRDLLQRSWQKQTSESRNRATDGRRPDGGDWQRREEGDPWAEHEGERGWSPDRSPTESAVAPITTPPTPRLALLALAVQAAGWWLRQRGSWFAALGLGCIVSGMAFLGGPIALAGLNVLEAAGDVYSLNQLLASSPDILVKG